MSELKIKDNIDLNILANYGFKITENDYKNRGDDNFEAIKNCGDICNKYCLLVHGRIISLYTEVNVYEHLDLATLYDLIKDDMIEKIE